MRRTLGFLGSVPLLWLAGCGGEQAPDATGQPDGDAETATTLDDQLSEVEKAAPGFGGMYVDADGVVHVLMVPGQDGEAAQRERAQGAIARVFGAERVASRVTKSDGATAPGIVLEPARFTFGQLRDWGGRLTRGALPLRDVSFTDVDEATNRVTVGVATASAQAAVERQLASLGVPRDSVTFTTALPMEFRTSLRDSQRPIAGGQQIERGTSICTLGFNALRQGVNGFVTNSHCTSTRGTVNGDRYEQPDGTDLGTEVADPRYTTGGDCPSDRTCRFSDSAFVMYDAGASFARGFLARSPIGSLEISGRVRVVGHAASVATGETLTRVGRTTGTTQGKVTRTCVNANVSNSNITMLCQTQIDYSILPGDSGGPVYRGAAGGMPGDVQLVGVEWGSNGEHTTLSTMAFVEQELGGLDTAAVERALRVVKSLQSGGSGTVTASAVGISCGSQCVGYAAPGTTVTLTASPSSGSQVSWSGCTSRSGNTCTVALTTDRTVTASFVNPVDPECYDECLDSCLADGGLHSQCVPRCRSGC